MGKKQRMTKLDLFVHGVVAVCFRESVIYYTGFRTGEYSKSFGQVMLNSANIKNRANLDESCNWFFTEGRRAEFNRFWLTLRLYGEEDRINIIDNIAVDDDDLPYMKMIHEKMHNIPEGGILAIDMARCFYLILGGKQVGYIDEKEAQERFLFGIRNLQEAYSSWEEFVIGYALGEKFTSVNASDTYVQNSMKYVKRLLTSPHSFMNKVEWNVKLDV